MSLNVKQGIKLGVVGCGKMASAILGGLYKNKFMNSENICVYDINMDFSGKLCKEYGFSECYSLKELFDSSDVILFAVKPFVIGEILSEVKEYYTDQLILSIVAGAKIKKYTSELKNSKIIRIMPNTPALVNEGASAICYSNNVAEDEIQFAYDLMSNCGQVIKTTEDKIDVITALSGSGPAFYYKIINDFAKSAQKLGLSYDDAIVLSAQTALGAAKMLLEGNLEVDRLIKNVTTPGGCTEVGNFVLNNSNIGQILDETIEKTMQKAIELG